MAVYTFRHLNGDVTEVYASTETFGRAEAMKAKWGEPKPLIHSEPGSKAHLVIGEPMYFGYGLDLISVVK